MDNYRRRLDVLEDEDSDFLSNVQEQNYTERIEFYNYTCMRRMVEPIAPQVPMDVAPRYATVRETSRPGVAYSSSVNAPLDPTTMPYGSSHLESNIASNANRSEPRSNWNGSWQSSFYGQYTSSTVRSERANLPHDSAHFGSHMTRRRIQTAVIAAPYSSAYTRMEADSKQAPSTLSWIGASYAASNTTICASQSWSNLAAPPYTSAYTRTEAAANLAPGTSQPWTGAAFNAASNSTICASQSWSNLGNGPAEFGSDLVPRKTKSVGVVAPYSSTEADSNLASSTSQSEISAAYNAWYAASDTSIWPAQSRSNLANGSEQSGNIAPRKTQTVGIVAPYSSAFTPTEADSNLAPNTSQSGISAAYNASYAASNTSILTARSFRTEQARYNLAHASTLPQSTMVSHEALHTSLNTTVRTAETRINLGEGSTQSQPDIASNEAQDTSLHTVGIAQLRSNLTTVTSQSNTGSNVAQHTTSHIAVSSTQPRNLAGTSQSRSNVAPDGGPAQPQTQNMTSPLRSQTSPLQVSLASSSRDDETKRNLVPWDKDLRKNIPSTHETEPHAGTAPNEGRERTERNCTTKMKYVCRKCHLRGNLVFMLHHLRTHKDIKEPNLSTDTHTHIVCPICQAPVKENKYNKHVKKWHSKTQEN